MSMFSRGRRHETDIEDEEEKITDIILETIKTGKSDQINDVLLKTLIDSYILPVFDSNPNLRNLTYYPRLVADQYAQLYITLRDALGDTVDSLSNEDVNKVIKAVEENKVEQELQDIDKKLKELEKAKQELLRKATTKTSRQINVNNDLTRLPEKQRQGESNRGQTRQVQKTQGTQQGQAQRQGQVQQPNNTAVKNESESQKPSAGSEQQGQVPRTDQTRTNSLYNNKEYSTEKSGTGKEQGRQQAGKEGEETESEQGTKQSMDEQGLQGQSEKGKGQSQQGSKGTGNTESTQKSQKEEVGKSEGEESGEEGGQEEGEPNSGGESKTEEGEESESEGEGESGSEGESGENGLSEGSTEGSEGEGQGEEEGENAQSSTEQGEGESIEEGTQQTGQGSEGGEEGTEVFGAKPSTQKGEGQEGEGAQTEGTETESGTEEGMGGESGTEGGEGTESIQSGTAGEVEGAVAEQGEHQEDSGSYGENVAVELSPTPSGEEEGSSGRGGGYALPTLEYIDEQIERLKNLKEALKRLANAEKELVDDISYKLKDAEEFEDEFKRVVNTLSKYGDTDAIRLLDRQLDRNLYDFHRKIELLNDIITKSRRILEKGIGSGAYSYSKNVGYPVGTTLGDNVMRMTSTERALASISPAYFAYKYATKSLQQEKLKKKNKGDFLFIIDKSGSMRGYKFTSALATVLAFYNLAKREGRNVYTMYFNQFPSPVYKMKQFFVGLLSNLPDGGTSINYAIRKALEARKKDNELRKIDTFILVTDGEDTISSELKKELRDQKVDLQCVFIGYSSRALEQLKKICDKIMTVDLVGDSHILLRNLVTSNLS